MAKYSKAKNTHDHLADFEPIKAQRPYFTYTLIIGLICFLAALYYIFYYKKEEKSVTEELLPKEMIEELGREIITEENIADENEIKIENFDSFDPKYPQKVYIKEKGNYYYVIIGSFFDSNLAEDFSNKLVRNRHSAYIIHNLEDYGFTYVALYQSKSMTEANEKLQQVDSKLCKNPWIKKY